MPDVATTANFSHRLPSLDGWWIARAAMLCGVRLPPDALPGLGLRLLDQKLYFGSDVGTIDVDGDLSPATIDILITRGPNRWRFIPGILRQHDERLCLCLNLSGADRPATFRSQPGSRVLLVTYERPPTRFTTP